MLGFRYAGVQICDMVGFRYARGSDMLGFRYAGVQICLGYAAMGLLEYSLGGLGGHIGLVLTPPKRTWSL